MNVIPLLKAEAQNAGNKASSLAKLMRAGFRVPNGFVILPEPKLDPGLIFKAFDNLNSAKVAVRSSAIGEDDDNAAWAGQLETFLNVTRKELIKKIEEVRASINSARAKAYGDQKNIKLGGIAVIVQEMIQSEVSGVAFSVHPVTQNTNHLVIEAVLGLGEGLVSGQITPDNYIVDKQSTDIIEKHLSSTTQKLTNEQIVELSNLIIKLENFPGLPIDVEWALNDGQFYITQTRAITTLG